MMKCDFCKRTCEKLGQHALFFDDNNMFCEKCAPKVGIKGDIWEYDPTVGVHCCKDCADDCQHDDDDDETSDDDVL